MLRNCPLLAHLIEQNLIYKLFICEFLNDFQTFQARPPRMIFSLLCVVELKNIVNQFGINGRTRKVWVVVHFIFLNLPLLQHLLQVVVGMVLFHFEVIQVKDILLLIFLLRVGLLLVIVRIEENS